MGIEFGLDTIGDIAGDQGRQRTGEEPLRLLAEETEATSSSGAASVSTEYTD